MTRRRALVAVTALALASWFVGLARPRATGLLPPSEFLGMDIGADGVLATYDEIARYWRAAAAASDRITLEDIGRTTGGRPYVVAIITSPENQQRLEAFRAINNRLYDPRTTSEREARSLIERGRTIVAIQMGIHSDEVAAPQMSLELAYRFATEESARMQSVLDQTILILSPSHNPDGAQLVAEWHRRTLGTAYYGGPLPFLYQRYVGHDNNRDWYMFTQKESRLTVERIWNAWHPQISYDLHQMPPNGARIFLPPYLDPIDPHIDPILTAQTDALGSHMAAELLDQGKTGVLTDAIYDLWTPARAYVDYHGGVRILSEVASARLAEPVTLPLSALGGGLGYDATRASENFPKVWRGGTWRLRDIMDYEAAALDALLDDAAERRRAWLTAFWDVNRHAVRPSPSRPYAVVVPASQPDPEAATEMLRALQLGDVEVHRARRPFTAGGVRYEAGSHVILLAQPAGAFADTLTDVQQYPDVRAFPGGPPQPPYDATAYTMPLLMGVQAVRVADAFAADLELSPAPLPVSPGRIRPRPAPVDGPVRYVFAHDSAGMQVFIRLARAGLAVGWARSAFVDAGRSFPAGTMVAGGDARVREALEAFVREGPLVVQTVRASAVETVDLRMPRIGLYESYAASIDEGWTRWIFDQWRVPFTSLRNRDLRAGAPSLRSRFDVVVLPDERASVIVDGIRPGDAPPEYVGGIGEEGVNALAGFVEAGGTLVALDSATELPIERFDLPVENVLRGRSRRTFYGPGSILRTEVDTTHPIGFGSPARSVAWFERSPAFRLHGRAHAVVRYPETGSPLLSGWLLGGGQLRGTAAVADVPLGRGHVVLFGFRPQYRAQTWATFGLFFNALFYSGWAD